jgi:DNA-binding transcriptional ArsR family regulator
MPGRIGQTPQDARWDSESRILGALASAPMRFKKLKEATELHQDTLSRRLKSLKAAKQIEYDADERLYKLSDQGFGEFSKRELIELVQKARSYIGGNVPELWQSLERLGGTGDRALDVITASTSPFAFPSMNVTNLVEIERIVHKYFILHALYWLAQTYEIDPRSLIGKESFEGLLKQLKQVMKPGKQVLAFIIDLGEVVSRLNVDYLKEILRVADIEDTSVLESPRKRRFRSAFERFAVEFEALEFIEKHGKAKLDDIATQLNMDVADAEQFLDGLLVDQQTPTSMIAYDKNGKFKAKVPWTTSLEPDASVFTVKMRQEPSKKFLRRQTKRSTVWYELSAPFPNLIALRNRHRNESRSRKEESGQV